VFRPGCLAAWQVKRTLAYIETNLESKLGVAHLADGVALSKGHFSRAFRQSLGIPPMVYVATRRIERAKIMMTSTSEQLAVIALACGFSDQSHLNRSFRCFVGVSPGRWRRSKRGGGRVMAAIDTNVQVTRGRTGAPIAFAAFVKDSGRIAIEC